VALAALGLVFATRVVLVLSILMRDPLRCREHSGGDLHHLGVESLAHLHAASAHAYAAVLVNVYQGARMVHRRVRE
jgi:hypothetical protein